MSEETSGFGVPDAEQEIVCGAVSDSMEMYLNRISKYHVLSASEEKHLAELAGKGDLSAKQRLVESNLKLVVSIAKAYAHSGVSLPDLIQEGNIGLIRAADGFDYRRGFRFSTYAVAWIRQSISRAIERHGRTIRVPSYVVQLARHLNRLASAIFAATGHEPTLHELACQAGLTEEQLALLLRSSEALVSLDAGAWDESAAALIERLEDEEALDPIDVVLNSERAELLMALMSGLSKTEKLIIEKRFGLGEDRTRTLHDIGQQLRVTRERVRQLEARALKKLRRAAVRDRLEEYLKT